MDARAPYRQREWGKDARQQSGAAPQQKNQNQNTRRHSQQPQNDVTDFPFLIVKVWHDEFLSYS